MTKQLPVSYLLLPKRYKGTKIIEHKSNIQFYKWPSSYQSVTYCYQRDKRTQKLFKINSKFTFVVTKQLLTSYLLLPKRYKGTKIINNKSNIQFYKWSSSYQSVTYCYQRNIRTLKPSIINPTSIFTVTKQLPVSYLLLPKRYKDTKIINNKSNIHFYSDQAVTSRLPKRYKGTKIIEHKSNIQFYKWPSSYQSVTYCYQRDIRTHKLFKIN